MKKIIAILLVFILIATLFAGCSQADKVGANISQQADNFNVHRKLTAFNVRTNEIVFIAEGNFSITKESDGDLAIIGEDSNGQYYKHFVCLSSEITYIVEDFGSTGVDKYKYEINFNPNMIIPIQPVVID
jgi:predicted small secreted protein